MIPELPTETHILENSAIKSAVAALKADCERQGYLTDDQIVRAVYKRKIGAEGQLIVRETLTESGIVVEGSADDLGFTPSYNLEENSNEDSVRFYLTEIGKTRLLRPEDEVILGRRIEMGRQALETLGRPDLPEDMRSELLRQQRIGHESQQQMISANLRLVVSVAKRYSRTFSMELLDLVQEGTIGLMRAAERFDYRRGFKFSTYATWWILQGVTRSISDKDRLIRLPVHACEALNKLKKTRRRLSALNGGVMPPPNDLAIHLGWPIEKVLTLLSVVDDVVSLDAPVGDSEATSLKDVLRNTVALDPEQNWLEQEKMLLIREALEDLGPSFSEVLKMRFGIGTDSEHTLQEIGDHRGVTRERIRQIESRALAKLLRRSQTLHSLWDHSTPWKTANSHEKSKPKNETDEGVGKSQQQPSSDANVFVAIFDRLPKLDQTVLTLRYGLAGVPAISLAAISNNLGVPITNLRKSESRALTALGQTESSFQTLLDKSVIIRLALSSLRVRSRQKQSHLQRRRSKNQPTEAQE